MNHAAYAYSQLGDTTKAKHFISLYDEQYGDYGVGEEDELLKIQMAKQLIGVDGQHNRIQAGPIMESSAAPSGSVSRNLEGSSHTFYIEPTDDDMSHLITQEVDHTHKVEEHELNIGSARQLLHVFEYEKGIRICLDLLKQDYDNSEAHELILETFHTLGFRNELALRVKDDLRLIMIESGRV